MPDGRRLLLRFTTTLLLAGSIGIGNGCADPASVSIEFPLSLRGAALVHSKHTRPSLSKVYRKTLFCTIDCTVLKVKFKYITAKTARSATCCCCAAWAWHGVWLGRLESRVPECR